jgi:hypothetical protein
LTIANHARWVLCHHAYPSEPGGGTTASQADILAQPALLDALFRDPTRHCVDRKGYRYEADWRAAGQPFDLPRPPTPPALLLVGRTE